MKYFDRHKPIQITDPKTGKAVASLKPLSHEGYANDYPLSDKKFVTGFKAITTGGAIQKAFQGTSAEIALEDDHYDLLKSAIENPDQQTPISPEMARQYLPFMESIMKPRDKPAKKEKKAKKNGKAKKPAAKKPSAASEAMN